MAAPKGKLKKFLILRIHDNIKHVLTFAAQPKNRSRGLNCSRIRPIVERKSSNNKKSKDEFWIIIELNSQKTPYFVSGRLFYGAKFQLALLWKLLRLFSNFWVSTFDNIKQSGPRTHFCATFVEKVRIFYQSFIKIFRQRNSNQTFHQRCAISGGNNNPLPLKTLT